MRTTHILHSSFLILVFLLSFSSSCTRDKNDLGAGYFYHENGGREKTIVSTDAKRGICGEIVAYDYNDDFIVAAQKPYENYCWFDSYVEDFPNGLNATYYWLIIKKDNIILGPYEQAKFKEIRERYKVPASLDVAPVAKE
jgi:hypothetical protein